MVTSMQIKAEEASCTGEARGLKEGDYVNMYRQEICAYKQGAKIWLVSIIKYMGEIVACQVHMEVK